MLNQDFEEALSWLYNHINDHYLYVDYYLNLKFLLNRDITGADLIRIGFNSHFRTNVGLFHHKKFYRRSMFAERNFEILIKRCDIKFSDHKKNLGNCNNYLRYIANKYPFKDMPRYQNGSISDLYRGANSLFAGGALIHYNADNDYDDDQEITPLTSIKKELLNSDALNFEGKWVHFDFTRCPELLGLISDLCTDSENELRKERGISAIGERWKSELEIYAFIKEIFNSYEVIRHFSPLWLTPMHLDVCVPKLNFGIEYQGAQHYNPVSIFGGKEGFERGKVRDNFKKDLCRKNELHLLEIKFDDDDPEKTIYDFVEKNLMIKFL